MLQYELLSLVLEAVSMTLQLENNHNAQSVSLTELWKQARNSPVMMPNSGSFVLSPKCDP